jgi:hypothetical protein
VTIEDYLASRRCDCERCRRIRDRWETVLPTVGERIRSMVEALKEVRLS